MKTLEDAKVSPGCLYMQIPVHQVCSYLFGYSSLLTITLAGQYGTMQFGKFEEIQKKGYHAAMDLLEKWDEEGKLPSAHIAGKDESPRRKKKGQSARRNSI